MIQGSRGHMSLIAMVLILFSTAVAAGVLLPAGMAIRLQLRREQQDATVIQLRDATAQVLNLLQNQLNEPADTPQSPIWPQLASLQRQLQNNKDSIDIDLQDVSSLLNPNWVSSFLLERTDLDSLLQPGKSIQGLQQYREEAGFSHDIVQHYQEWFQEDALQELLSPYSFANINVSDEHSLRQLIAQRAGEDRLIGEYFHSRIQQQRQLQELLQPDELERFFGSHYDLLTPVVNAEPMMNLHFAPPRIIRSILAYTAWELPSPATVAEDVLSRREAGLQAEQLPALLGIEADHPLLQYFGVRTHFWQIQARQEDRVLTTVVAMLNDQAVVIRSLKQDKE